MNILKPVFIKFCSFTRSTCYPFTLYIVRLWCLLWSWYLHIKPQVRCSVSLWILIDPDV